MRFGPSAVTTAPAGLAANFQSSTATFGRVLGAKPHSIRKSAFFGAMCMTPFSKCFEFDPFSGAILNFGDSKVVGLANSSRSKQHGRYDGLSSTNHLTGRHRRTKTSSGLKVKMVPKRLQTKQRRRLEMKARVEAFFREISTSLFAANRGRLHLAINNRKKRPLNDAP